MVPFTAGRGRNSGGCHGLLPDLLRSYSDYKKFRFSPGVERLQCTLDGSLSLELLDHADVQNDTPVGVAEGRDADFEQVDQGGACETDSVGDGAADMLGPHELVGGLENCACRARQPSKFVGNVEASQNSKRTK